MSRNFNIVMPDAIYNDLKETASRAGCSVSAYCRRIITWALYGQFPDISDREEEE